MGGSKKTIVGLSVTKMIDEPEKVYKSVMRDVFSNGPKGTRAMMSSLGRQFIDNQKLFHSKYLESLGYAPTVNVKYKNIDSGLVSSYIESVTSDTVSNISRAKYDAPTAEEYMMFHLQETYSDFNLALREFSHADGKKYRYIGNTVVSTTTIEATMYRISSETVSDDALSKGLIVDVIYDTPEIINGIKFWKYRDSLGVNHYVAIEYMYINIPGLNVQGYEYAISEFNNKIYTRSKSELIGDSDGGLSNETVWTLTAKAKVYINSSGAIQVDVVKQNLDMPTYKSRYYVEAVNSALVDIKKEIEDDINLHIASSQEKLIVTYLNSNNKQKILISTVDENVVTSLVDIEAYPIIPLKSNYKFIKDTNNRKAILNKIGITGDDFEESLSNNQIRASAIMFTVSLEDENKNSIKYMYNLLDNLISTTAPGSKNTSVTTNDVEIKFEGFDLKTKISMTNQIKSGSIGAIGTYAYENTSMKSKILRKQINELYYNEIIINNATSYWNLEGYRKEASLFGKESENCVLPLLQTAMENFTLEESLYVMGKSLSIVVLSITVVKTKWYQTGFFKFVLIVALIVITVLTAGAAAAATSAAYTAAYGAGVATLAVTTTAATLGMIAGTIVALGGIVSVLSVMGVDTGVAGQVIGVAGLVVGGYTMYLNGLASGVGQISTLQMANGLVGAASMASDINAKGTMAKIQESYDQLNKRMKESEEEGKELYADIQKGMWIGTADREPELLYYMSSTDYMCNYNSLYDYDGVIDAAIGS